jgi:hypothetical protein
LQGATELAVAALRWSAATALKIPNLFLAAEAESTLSTVCRLQGDHDRADAAAARAAALYFQTGRGEKAARMLEGTLVERGSTSIPVSPISAPAAHGDLWYVAFTPAAQRPG